MLALSATVALVAGATGSANQQDDFKMAIVTDIGSLQDKSFNQLANEGRIRVGKQLGIQTRVYVTQKAEDRLPNLLAAADAGYDLIFGVGFFHAEHLNVVAPRYPRQRFAGIDITKFLSDEPEELHGHGVRRARGRLPRRLPRGPHRQAPGRQAGRQRGRRERRAGDREVHQRLHPGREEGEPEDQGARELRERPDLLRPGEVQGSRPAPDRPAARRSSSRSPAAAASAPSPPRRRRRSGGSASTPTSATSARTC